MYFLVVGQKGIWVFSKFREALDFVKELDKQGETYHVVQSSGLDSIISDNYN